MKTSSWRFCSARRAWATCLLVIFAFTSAAGEAVADVTLKLGDILIIETGRASVGVIDAATGAKTTISEGGLLLPLHRAVGVALALDGDLIVVHRDSGLIRINTVTGDQTVLSQGGLFSDPWAIAVNKNTGDIYVADSGFDQSRPAINERGKIIRVNPTTGAQTLIVQGSACTTFNPGKACLNTTSAGSYVSHPYGIAIDYTVGNGTLVVADMTSFNGQGAIYRVQPQPGGTQTLLWGPSNAVPAPVVARQSPMSCPMGVAVEPNGNILATTFTYPVPPTPTMPAPATTFYGCIPGGIYRLDLVNHAQRVFNANAPAWEASRVYAVGMVVRSEVGSGHVQRVTTAGVSGASTPNWNTSANGTTADGTVVWQNIGNGANWLIPFGLDTEPAPTAGDPNAYNVVVAEEGYSMAFRLNSSGQFTATGAPLASDLSYITALDVINFTPQGGFDTEPVRSNGFPSGALPAGTTQTTIGLSTAANATCRYSTSPGVAYGSMPNTFSTTGGTTHSRTVSGLSNGNNYNFYVRCSASASSTNTDDYVISFSVPLPPSATPIAAYSFSEGTGSDVADDSNHGNDGDISGATWTNSGKYGNALAFDGQNDWVTVNASSSLDLTTAMTLEAWVYPTSATGTRDVLIKEGAGAEVYNLYARNWQGLPEANVFAAASTVAVGPQISVNAWTHLAGTYDGSVLRLYLNGALAASTATTGGISTSSGPLRIGGNDIWGEFFEGRIDEIRVYNRALSASEIATDMNTPINAGGGGPDTTPPLRFNGAPTGALPSTTTQATLSLSTSENATCRYSTQAGTSYFSMPNTFSTTGATAHSRTVTGLSAGNTYNYYVRCRDNNNNSNTDDFLISFSVATAAANGSSFTGTEAVLSEGGAWDSPGSWAELQKNNGAFAVGLDAAARRMTPALGVDHYGEITYDQDPGSSTWVGVMTRVQSATNGSGYLAIAYAGSVQLYRVDDVGGLNFTQLATAAASVGTAPRRLRLESQGTTHRVYFNGGLLLTATSNTYTGGQPGIAASVFGGPQVKLTSYFGGDVGGPPPPDVTAPTRTNGAPTGALAFGTTQATLSLTTSENATCRYGTQANIAYASLPNTFTTTGSTSHSRAITGLTNGTTYNYYVRCIDGASNANTDDYLISFSVASASGTTSSFSGVENPLSEGGVWSSPGSWADLQKNNGAFATGLNAMGRLTTPSLTANHFSEITYDQDPGSASWVGVMTRVQSASNGSGYLAIVYAGQVRLYRADDAGSLNFTLLASASASLGASPRRLRLESFGNTHRVYFNGALAITFTASNFGGGQPGIAASVFGGPQVKMQSFLSGNLAQ